MKKITSINKAIGFTLVELLVTVSVITVLIAIIIPTLSKTREVAGQTQSLANIRSLGVTLQLYAAENHSRFPFYTAGDPMHMVPPHQDTTDGGRMDSVWNIDKMWPTLMHGVAPWNEHLLTWYSPGREHIGPPNVIPLTIGFGSGPVSYHYSTSFVASPQIWNGNGDATIDDIGPVSVTSVAHTSSKVVMFDNDRAYLNRPTANDLRPVLFTDGSASARLDSDATQPVSNPLYFPDFPRRYLDTPDGYLGRDF